MRDSVHKDHIAKICKESPIKFLNELYRILTIARQLIKSVYEAITYRSAKLFKHALILRPI